MLDPERLIGLIIDDQYHLRAVKGIGAFGVVYAADVVADGRVLGEAAVKLLWPPDERSVDAIRAEVQAMNQLQHAHLIAYKSSGQVTDGKASGAIYIAMDLAADSLANLLASGKRLSEAAGLTLCQHIGSALGYLEQRGAIHCDVKPANVLRVGRVWKLGDFGLVRGVHADGGSPGTPRYKAPEALTRPGPRSDIWSLGVVVQEAMTGEFPYDGEVELRLMAQMLTSEPRVSDKLPPSVRSIISGCLTKDPDKRWSAQRVLEEVGKAAASSASSLPKAAQAPGQGSSVTAPSSGTQRGTTTGAPEPRKRSPNTPVERRPPRGPISPSPTATSAPQQRVPDRQPNETRRPSASGSTGSARTKTRSTRVEPRAGSPNTAAPVRAPTATPASFQEFRRRFDALRRIKGPQASALPELELLLEEVKRHRPSADPELPGGGAMGGCIGAGIGLGIGLLAGGPIGCVIGGLAGLLLGAALGAAVYVMNLMLTLLGLDGPRLRDWDSLAQQIEKTTEAMRARSQTRGRLRS